jgi:hypothetical protein
MAHYLIAHLKALVFQVEPLAAFGTAHGFAPVEESGEGNDEEDCRACGGEDFGVVYEGEKVGCGQRRLLIVLPVFQLFLAVIA